MIARPSLACALMMIPLLAPSGCIELQALLGGSTPPSAGPGAGGGDAGEDGSGNDPGDGSGDLPVVSLAVSNPAPPVNEEVVLTCRVVRGDATNATFSFDPDFARLLVDEARGVASFIVADSDVATSFTFRCAVTTDAGSSAPSNPQVVIPVAIPAP